MKIDIVELDPSEVDSLNYAGDNKVAINLIESLLIAKESLEKETEEVEFFESELMDILAESSKRTFGKYQIRLIDE